MPTIEQWQAGIDEIQQRRQTRSSECNFRYSKYAEQAAGYFDLKGRVLDVGCGTGSWLSALPNITEYVGLDVSPLEKPGFEYIVGNAEHLPFGCSSFDGVLCYSVLQHVINPVKVLAEISRVLKPKGTLALQVCINARNPMFLHFWNSNTMLALVSHLFDVERFRVVDGLYFQAVGWPK